MRSPLRRWRSRSSDESFRDDVRATIRKHDPDADELRNLAGDLEELADRYETQESVL